MPSVLLAQSVAMELGASEPWPSEGVELYQPFEVEQILLPDNANVLAVQAFLHMCHLDFTVEMRTNAEFMSPSGKVPFIRAGKFVISEIDPIIAYVYTKGISLTEHLDSAQKADMRAYMSLVNNVLGNAELYLSWIDEVTHNQVTKPRFGSVHPWPLNRLLTWQRRNQVWKKLGALGWTSKSLDDVYQEVEYCCSALSERLDNQQFFFNNKPTELDALVFGHLFTILTTTLPDNRLSGIVRKHTNLVELCQGIDKEYFDRISGGVGCTTSSGTSSKGSSEAFEKVPSTFSE